MAYSLVPAVLHIGYSFRLTARGLLYAPSHRQDSTYHSLCYTSRGTLDGTRNSSMGPPQEIDPMTQRTTSESSYHGGTSRSFYIGLHHPTDRILQTRAFVTLIVKHWLEREIPQWVHYNKSIWQPSALRALYHRATSHSVFGAQQIMKMCSLEILNLSCLVIFNYYFIYF